MYVYVYVGVYWSDVYVYVGCEYVGRFTTEALIGLIVFGVGGWLRMACVMDTVVSRPPSIVDKMSAAVFCSMTTCF